MKRILITTAAIIGFAGIAAAQEAPTLPGNVSPSVENNYDADVTPPEGIDFNATASITGTGAMDSNWDAEDMRRNEAARFNDPDGGR